MNVLLPKNSTIMLIDDNEIDIFINQRVLKNFSDTFQIVTFSNSTAALEYLSKNKALPKIILLDLHLIMNKSFEFLECYEKLNIEKKNTTVYVLSTFIFPSDLLLVNEDKNCAGYIEKPLSMQKLFEEMEKKAQKDLLFKTGDLIRVVK